MSIYIQLYVGYFVSYPYGLIFLHSKQRDANQKAYLYNFKLKQETYDRPE